MRSLLRAVNKAVPQRSPLRLVWHHAKALAAALLYRFPARNLTVISVTGTDGKTTTVGMVLRILQTAGFNAGALSTAFLQIRNEQEWNATQKTSPSPFLIQKFLRRLVRSGCTHAVLEVSSHGLVQGRVHYTWPLVAAVTNVTPEHLDYHGTLEQYRRDKGLLFSMVRSGGTKILNMDDESTKLYQQIPTTHTLTYGHDPQADLWISDRRSSLQGSESSLHCAGATLSLSLTIPGAFNLENACCAIACAHAVGIKTDLAVQALRTFSGVAGRMERIDEGQPFAVFVDFTVTPAAYEKTLTTLRTMLPQGKRILVLTGSCGDRYREKRPIVGRLCSELADVVVVTNEDPYTEDPQKIIDEVFSGIDQSKTQAHKIFDRREAIAFLFAQAKPGDAVMLCAKGADTTMWTNEGQIPWNERAIARELLQTQKK
ncbi:MAG: UDP-N-acetylmuramoyl-L-alanyl-D-glutamate--2,6-diaminopimelate ligase [Candidatus Peribacteraceae bacterium]|nr:UDP-N-acetylmuramoyl-L-alanyl-D-glutamate--2,6-diaminopimelate ligase [Candidatus Peribacteraceae bacterium]MDD5742456.1 UDP-N-acetylmuramoyl-L-alanyl-D-glutamate--2,6-diaminopimelate ligase [Candidatus Peribacteraceae bacterium]